MMLIRRYKKFIAAFFCTILLTEIIAPVTTYGLTSGPAQPEMKGFEPIGNSDMVDLFSGDFSYNIPLLDVGGYPVNLSYHSGSGMDDEASWVGYGWSLNPGAINRQLRGIPDDFNGSEMMSREISMKDHITKGAKFSATLDLLGIPKNKIAGKGRKKKKLNFTNPTFAVGVNYDNYRGIGVEIGANSGISLTDYVAGDKTVVPKDSMVLKGNLGLNLSSFDGASLSNTINFSVYQKEKSEKEKVTSYSVGFPYNSRAGLQSMTLGVTKNSLQKGEKATMQDLLTNSLGHSAISFNEESYIPTIDVPKKNTSLTFTLHLGPEVQIAFPGLGVTGFYSKQSLSQKLRQLPSYGYLHSDRGKDDPNALMDLNREKDIPYNSDVNFLPVPVPTYDLFMASSQDGSGQYRAYRGSSSVFFDHRTEAASNALSAGVELGFGTYFTIGGDAYFQTTKTSTQKWVRRNNFLNKGDYVPANSSAPSYEAAYFKRVGEPVPADKDYLNKIQNISPVAVSIPGRISNGIEGAEAAAKFRTKTNSNGSNITDVLQRNKREARNTAFSYLTAAEAINHALDKTIKDYHPDSLALNNCGAGAIKSTLARVGNYRRKNHISEITITGDDGKRSIYGIPVYNSYQEEVTFNVSQNSNLRKKGIIGYNKGSDNSTSNTKGRDNYYSREITPAYTTSHLLTGILSPDYVDVTGNGITDDDLGTAVKFNYTKLNNLYKWRTPYAFGADSANYNEGLLSDTLDDKANCVFGQKEIWYLHSIESKTMIAHFITANRDDGFGVVDANGAKDTTVALKRLKEIRLYSKSDLKMNGGDLSKTTPIKIVHFEYDYSICRNLPNSRNNAGKLTLRKVYFTFGFNNKGKLHPYEFNYDTAAYNSYDYRQYDRWGNLKDVANNPAGLNNAEFPYTIQDTAVTNKFARAWHLNKIILPSGGSIKVSYESDDYAYVQDKRASVMCQVKGAGSVNDSSALINANDVIVSLPVPVPASELKYRYFQEMDKIYFKFLLDLDKLGHKEFVPGYAKIKSISAAESSGGLVTSVRINLEKINGINPVAHAGWQFLRMNLPKYAYPGSDNFESNSSDIKKIVMSLVTSIKSITELVYGFEDRAKNKGYSSRFDMKKSWVRLCSPVLKKLGGGSRVKKIEVSDEWAALSGTTGAITSTYAQLYDYTTKDEKGNTISSGVASYEPMLGNDENPFRQPVPYKQNQFLAIDNYYYIEMPMGESFFPGASVGYSKVTVKSIGSGDTENVNRTGTTISEFFTAKDYPTKVDWLGLEKRKPSADKLLTLVGVKITNHLGLGQGYSIELNDMHGKPRAVTVLNKSGEWISGVEYFYKSINNQAEKRELSNEVKVIGPEGIMSDAQIGMDVEIFNDMRQQIADNLGVSAKISAGSGAILFFPLPFAFPGIGANYERRSYRASSTVKIIHRFAIQEKVKKTENGSSITTENLLWDSETGNVLLTRTQNEFDDPIYSFAYPAHWVYNGMGQSYRNLGTFFEGFTTNSEGKPTNSIFNSILAPGDELIEIGSSNKYWVISSPVNGLPTKELRLIDGAGNIGQVSNVKIRLLRSGRRNMANTAIATIVSMKNPIANERLNISQLSGVLDAKATVFSEEWSVPVRNKPGYVSSYSCVSEDCMRRFFYASLISKNTVVSSQNRSDFFALDSDNKTVGGILDSAFGASGVSPDSTYSSCRNSFINGQSATNMEYYLFTRRIDVNGDLYVEPLDTAQLGPCKIRILGYSSHFVNFAKKSYITLDTLSCYNANFVQVVDPSDPPGECHFKFYIGSNNSCQTGPAGGGPGPLVDIPALEFKVICPPQLTYNACADPVGTPFNPYNSGVLGNWRAKENFAYHIARQNFVGNTNIKGGTDIRKSGSYQSFNPFWKYNYTNSQWEQNPTSDQKWIASNQMTYFNSKGLELENKDALNRYSSALFGYLESMPVGVASNAQYREIAYDGFEDYGFGLQCADTSCPSESHFNFKSLLNGSTIDTTTLKAHSGKYSLKLNGVATLTKTVYSGNSPALYSFDNSGRYILGANELAKGFSPIPGKKYILSFWVHDGSPRTATTGIGVHVNNGSNLLAGQSWPIVEGWKRIELAFTLSSMDAAFELDIDSGGGTIYLDDIRIHPFEAQMKSFAYDPSSTRLMAEMDENNFSTFYEYDDEGILVRVKKETERGIMTIRETRSSMVKK